MPILRPKLTDSEILRRHPASGAFGAAGVTLLCLLIEPSLGHRPALFVYLAAIVLVGPMIDRAGVFIMAAVSALAWNFFFTAPVFTFYMNNREDIALLVLFVVVIVVVAYRARSSREHEADAHGDEERRLAFYEITRELTSGAEMEKSVALALRRLGEAYEADATIIRFHEGAEKPFSVLGDKADDDAIGSARWVVENRLPFTNHMEVPDEGRVQHFVLPVGNELAVLRLSFRSAHPPYTERAESLRMIAHLFALSLERAVPNAR